MNDVITLASWQVWLVGLVASLLVALINWLAKAKDIKLFGKVIQLKPIHLGRFWLTLILLLISCGLGYWWYPFSLPAWPSFSGIEIGPGVAIAFEYAGNLIQSLLPYVGAAMALYNLLLNYVTDAQKRKQIWQDIREWFMRRLGMPV